MDWWSKALAKNAFSSAEIQALPSQHWSARGLSDRLQTLWASWSINFGDFTVWFAGDTGYNDIQFKQIGDTLGKVDLAKVPGEPVKVLAQEKLAKGMSEGSFISLSIGESIVIEQLHRYLLSMD